MSKRRVRPKAVELGAFSVSRHLSGAERANERMASATAAAAVSGGVCPLPAMGTRYAFGKAREFFSEADGDWLILLTMDDYCLCRDGANAVGDVISSHEYSHCSGEPCRRLVQHPFFPYLFDIVVSDGHLQQSDRGGFHVTSRECVSRCCHPK